MLAPNPLADPFSLLRLSPHPATYVSSAGSGWDGALVAEATTAPAGEILQEHQVVSVQRWLTPACIRSRTGPARWSTHPPGFNLFLPGDAQHGEWRGSIRYQLLFITAERVQAALGTGWERSGLTRWRGPRFELPFVAHLLSALMRDCEAGYPAGPLAGDALVAALVAYLDRRSSGPAPARPGALGRRLHLVREYIEANLARPLRLAELARMAGVGARRFTTLFAAETGWSPHRYLVNRRIERAKALMLDTRLTLADIGSAVGFPDPAQFSRVFRQHTGESPRAYRRR
jgi:AraC-like DNA-binding protein